MAAALTIIPAYATTTATTMGIVLSCIINRLARQTETDEIKEVIHTLMSKDKSLEEAQINTKNYSEYMKVLKTSERIYQKCDIEKYTDGQEFVKCLEKHLTYKYAQSHNNNVTWYQISEMIQFTVDLVEECYDTGRTELVQFIIDWCVSFINQQSCIYTSDGWYISLSGSNFSVLLLKNSFKDKATILERGKVDLLTMLPDTSEPSYKTSLTCLSSVPSTCREATIETPIESPIESPIENKKQDSEDTVKKTPVRVSSAGSSSHTTHGDSPEVLSREKTTKEIISEDKSFTKSTSSSLPRKDSVGISAKKELFLLRCSCGHANGKREGNFLGHCSNPDCERFTCLICSSSGHNHSRFSHMARHKVKTDSPITKVHIDTNAALYNTVCRNCKNKNCVGLVSLQSYNQYYGLCKLCESCMCLFPGCKYLANTYNELYKHNHVHHASKKFTSASSIKPAVLAESRQLYLLRCACTNMTERENKFWSKCSKPSSPSCEGFHCLICGRVNKSALKEHLAKHQTDSKGLITDEHLKLNWTLYNKICGNCGQKSSGRYTLINVKGGKIRCKCCNSFLCSFPGCGRHYPVGVSLREHYLRMHP